MLRLIVTVVVAFLLFRAPAAFKRWKEEKAVAEKYGCAPPPKSCSKWPLTLDFLVAAFRETAKGSVMQFFSWVCENSDGNTFETNVLGDRCINTIEPENVKAVLDTQFSDFGLSHRYPNMSPLLGRGIFTSDGSAWKRSRELLRPQFTKRRLDHFDENNTQVENLVERINVAAASSPLGKIDLQPIFNRFTLDTTTYMLFGKSIDSLVNLEEGDIAARFADAFRYSQFIVSQRERIGRLWDGPKFRKAIRIVHSYIDSEIQRAITDKESREKAGINALEDEDVKKSVIEALLGVTRDKETLRDQAVNVLLAGRDTTACTLTWAFYQLVRHPHVLKKLRAEIREVLGTGTDKRFANKNDLRKLPYLAAVLKETLRLYPVVPINIRHATCTTTLPRGGGENGSKPVLVRKGQFVGYATYVMHRRKDIYGPDAMEFKPERWEVPEGEKWCLKNVGYGYLPFNGGPRVCLGQEFALLEASFAVIRILQECPSVTLPDGVEVKPVGLEKQDVALVLSSMEGCLVEIST